MVENYRDVGEWIAYLGGGTLLAPGRLLRSGALDTCKSLNEVGNPKTVVNLRRHPDPDLDGTVRWLQIAADNGLEKYDTQQKEVRKWLNKTLAVLCDEACELPVLFHCRSGKDRTGVVIAATLTLLGVPSELVVAEYLLSTGEVRNDWITLALQGFGKSPERYFDRIDGSVLRKRLRG